MNGEKTILENLVGSMTEVLSSDDSSLDQMQEVADFTKKTRKDLDDLTLIVKGEDTNGERTALGKLISSLTNVLVTDDSDLDQMQEIVDYIKKNRELIETLAVTDVAGLEDALALKINISDIVDNLLSTLTNVPLSANQGRVLKEQIAVLDKSIEAINTLLTTDDTSLDELQEIVNFIKQNKSDLEQLAVANIAGLEDALALKVNIASIVDTVTSTLKDAPLSANQGRVLKEEIVTLKSVTDEIQSLLVSDDTTLDNLQKVIAYIKQNKERIESLAVADITGLEDALNSKVDKSKVLTPVPANAKFTDTLRPISDSVSSEDSTTSASSKSVKMAYEKAVSAYNKAGSTTGISSTVVQGRTGNVGGGCGGRSRQTQVRIAVNGVYSSWATISSQSTGYYSNNNNG